MRLASVFLLLASLVYGQDALLGALRSNLLNLRNHSGDHLEVRGASPDLTLAKHQLRSWIEMHLNELHAADDPEALKVRLNELLKSSGLFAPETAGGFDNGPGFLGPVDLFFQRDLLILKTGLSVQVCGTDESIYAYAFSGRRWRRVFETEQDTYTEKEYKPQYIQTVDISSPGERGERLALTVGVNPWCTSNWQPIYYRIWRLGRGGSSKALLLEKTEPFQFVAAPVRGQISGDDVFVEFSGEGTSPGFSSDFVVQYRVEPKGIRYIATHVTMPRDFIAEWLDGRSLVQSLSGSLLRWHEKLQKVHLLYSFATRCTAEPDQWQVRMDMEESGEMLYFLVRWRLPYDFTLLDVSSEPRADCDVEDPRADDPPPVLPETPTR